MRLRTPAGIILEKILHENKHRYLWCWNGESEGGEDSLYDCACCIMWLDNGQMHSCGCICHERIEEMASTRHIKLWLLALESMDRLPRFFTSYGEKLEASKKVFVEHERYRVSERWTVPECTCEYCQFVRTDVHRKFKLPGEEGYEEPSVPDTTKP